MSDEQKPTIDPEVQALLKDVRRFISDSKDDWGKRRELLDRINAVVPDGEMDVFVAAVREMARIGASYTDMLQTFNQLFTTQQAGAQFAEMFARGFANNPFLARTMPGMVGVTPNAFEMWRQMSEFVAAQAKNFTPGGR
jgi:hypothetical protein